MISRQIQTKFGQVTIVSVNKKYFLLNCQTKQCLTLLEIGIFWKPNAFSHTSQFHRKTYTSFGLDSQSRIISNILPAFLTDLRSRKSPLKWIQSNADPPLHGQPLLIMGNGTKNLERFRLSISLKNMTMSSWHVISRVPSTTVSSAMEEIYCPFLIGTFLSKY